MTVRAVPRRTPRIDPDTWIDPAAQVIGAVVLSGAVVEEGAQVGAGALVPPGKVVPAEWLMMGVPAKPVRRMTAEELEAIRENAREYVAPWRRDYGSPGDPRWEA